MVYAEEPVFPEHRALLLLSQASLAAKLSLWHVSAVVERVGSAEAVLAGDFEPQTHWELGVRAAAQCFEPERAEREQRLTDEMAEWAERGLKLVTVLEADYPLNLRSVYDRPPWLFYRGELHPDDAYALAVVGTRNPTDAGRRRATRMARLLVAEGVTVLSGLARGIDTEAHTAALDAGGRTIAVLGSGIDRIYPPENMTLADAITERGAVISQFFPSTPPSRGTFPLRNAVTSGLGQGTLVVEATRTSGARLQARLACEHGKAAFLLRSLVEEHEWARGFRDKYGAQVVTDVQDVLPHLRRPDDLRQWLKGEADGGSGSTSLPGDEAADSREGQLSF